MPQHDLINFLHRYRFWWLILTMAGLWVVTPGLKKAAEINNSLEIWFLKDDPALKDYYGFQEKFGNDELVILMVKDENTLLQSKYFQKFILMTQALENIPEVAQVIGPGNAKVLKPDPLVPFTVPLLADSSEPEMVKQTLAEMPFLREQIFSPDLKTARFLIALKLLPEFDARRVGILKKIKTEVHRYFPEKQSFFGGVGIIYAGLNELSEQDFALFAGMGYALMFLLILLIYRSWLVLVYALLTVGIATYLTLGIYGLLDFRLNLMTILLPAILILLGIMDVMHIINEKQQLQSNETDGTQLSLSAMQKVFRPCLFTSLTNMAGFLALLSSPMAILKNFGIFAALGIFLCFILTYLLGFVLLPFIKPKQAGKGFSGNSLVLLLEFVLRKKALFSAISLAILIAGIAGIFKLRADTYTLGYFPKNHQVVQDHLAMEKAWGAYMPLELMVESTAGASLHSPEILLAARTFSDSVHSISGTGQIFGFHTLFQAGLNAQFGEKALKMFQSRSILNQSDKQIKQLYPELSSQFIHEPSQTGRITVFGEMTSARALTAKTDSLLKFGKAAFGNKATVKPAGYQPLYANIVQYVTISQTHSLLLALLLVFWLIWIFIRNSKMAVLAIIPNIYPIIIMLGIMGWAGINLDVATASIAAIVLSVCVDDTIHFIFHYYGS